MRINQLKLCAASILISSGNHGHIKFKPGSIEKNVSTVEALPGIEPTPSRNSYLYTSVARALHRHRKGVGSISARGLIVDTFSQLFLGWIWDVYDFYSTYLPSNIRPNSRIHLFHVNSIWKIIMRLNTAVIHSQHIFHFQYLLFIVFLPQWLGN